MSAVIEEPWKTEPSYKKWIDPATGLRCLIRRNPTTGTLCGYVRVPRNNTLFRRQNRGGPVVRLRVHGGVTYADRLWRSGGGRERGWWVGFDTAHAWDYLPAMASLFKEIEAKATTSEDAERARGIYERGLSRYADGFETYRDFPFVMAQCVLLAAQVKRAEK